LIFYMLYCANNSHDGVIRLRQVSSHDLPSLTWSKYIYTYCQLYHG